MPYNAIVSDWNGSLFEYATDEVQNKKIAYAVLGDAKAGLVGGNLLRIGDVVGLLRAKKELKRRLREYRDGQRHLWEVYEPFNDRVLRGRDVAFIEGVVDDYARESASKVDGRMVRPIQSAHSNGKSTGILSVSFDYSIQRILEEAGFDEVFDHIVSNSLRSDKGKAVGLTLDIYGKKADALLDEFFRGRGFREDTTLYVGDSEDDEPVAERVGRGHFVVPFFASDGFKQHMASRYGAFVPEDEKDFSRFLEKS